MYKVKMAAVVGLAAFVMISNVSCTGQASSESSAPSSAEESNSKESDSEESNKKEGYTKESAANESDNDDKNYEGDGEGDGGNDFDNESKALSEWPPKGNFIDESENHLSFYEMRVEDGYAKDGWGVMVIIGEDMYFGDLNEEGDGSFSGTISTLDEEGNPLKRMKVSIMEENGQVVLHGDEGKEYRFDPDETDCSALIGEVLPFFQYDSIYAFGNHDKVEAAAYNYLSFDKTNDYDPSNVMIPFVNIVEMDESDPKDVLLYGDYYLFEFTKEEDVLRVVSGGHCPGIIHMERFGDDETAVYDAVGMDEAYTDSDAVEMFGEYYGKYHELSSDPKIYEEGLAQVIADYVSANSLEVTKYQLSGEEPKELPESHAGQPRERVELPAYAYPDPSAKEAVIYQYLIEKYSEELDADEHDVTIPYAVIISEDEGDPEDVVVLLDGWVMCYNLEGETLEMMSGAGVSGAAHLKKTEDGYELISFDDVSDGSSYDESAKRIFGDSYDDFLKIDEKTREEVRKQVLKDYVRGNGLEITGYRNFGTSSVEF